MFTYILLYLYMILICKYCGNKFESKNLNQSFCSKSCSGKYQQQAATEAAKIIKNDRIKRYYIFPKRCKYCDSILQYEDRSKTFCNSSCAATYNNSKRVRTPWTEDQRKKFSESAINRNLINGIDNAKSTTRTPRQKICKYCGKKFTSKQLPSGKYSSSKFCSDECRRLNNIEVGKKALIVNKENGTWKPWQSRNISSYPERFFERVLKNNSIPYTREKYINGYFLDFYIEINNRIIDLEIDGKQHKETREKDRMRDENLKLQGIEVYRIKWNSINSIKGKENMKVKINDFLTFYNN